MKYVDSHEEAEFRARVREWLHDNIPAAPPPDHDERGNHYTRDWHRELYEAGWLGLSWPIEHGGQGLSPIYDAIVNEELGACGAPSVRAINHLARAFWTAGTEEQMKRFLPAMLRGDDQWCQGFSEPGAGSDLASLKMSATRDGELYVLNGEKIWTSRAQWADWCLVLARSDPQLPKREGISCFAVDMNAPGITVRPLKQIWGTSEFNEVFFDDVKVSIDCRIGDEGAGWPLATSVLSSERSAADVGFVASFRRVFDELDTLVTRERNLPANAELQLETIYTAYEACRLHIYSTLSRRAGGQPSGAETSVDKLLMNRVIQMLGALELDLDFVPGLIGQRDETTYRYLYGRAASIYGGTEQVQRNIIAQRVLEMPRGR